MIVNFNESDALKLLEADYDYVIGGAGAAGITLAIKLSESGKRVLLLEGGGESYSEDSQSIYEGENIGIPYYDPRISRLRYLGGTTNHWGGQCRPLDSHDFDERKEINHPGWPFDKNAINKYSADTFEILDLRKAGMHDRKIPGTADFTEIEFFYSTPTRMGQKYHKQLEESSYITLLLNANISNIILSPNHEAVSHFVIKKYHQKQEYVTSGKNYILAMGGIENPRLLLNANSQIDDGLGNSRGLVGRFFMEHAEVEIGKYIVTSDLEWGQVFTSTSPTREFIQRNNILNSNFRLFEYRDSAKKFFKRNICDSEMLTKLAKLVRGEALNCKPQRPIAEKGLIQIITEQEPNYLSRVKLGAERDALGLLKVEIDWRLTKRDIATIKTTSLAFAKEVAKNNLARIQLDDAIYNNKHLTPENSGLDIRGGFHHMGTTRMAGRIDIGVVDSNCKIFGISNLYIAGSSVFPTGGHANPTYTIIQLTLKLADHLLEQRY